MTQDRRLDRIENFDARSTKYAISNRLPDKAYDKPISKVWPCRRWLDQGTEGACVAFGWCHELIAAPKQLRNITEADAFKVYRHAQTIDEWPGEAYSGTSVLAGVKAVQHFWPNYIKEYRWGFSLRDMIATLGYHGPIVLGLRWYRSMYKPDSKGILKVTAAQGVAGGHCILARGVDVRRELIILRNSWGKNWGLNGDCKIRFSDMEFLLNNGGEQCIPVRRGR